jgi:cobalt-zinc-cadmium efflux system membrane fusion protein
MTTASNTHKPDRNRRIVLGAGVATVGLIAAFGVPQLVRRTTLSPSTTAVATPANVLTVPAGVAGTVGDLTITEEAMQLAEIKVAPVNRQRISEKLVVSGVIEAGGDRLAKVTPRVAGKASRVLAVVGDDVKAGQTLALIESAELAQAQAAYNQAVARVRAGQTNLSRQRQLAQIGAFSGPAVEESRTRAVDAEQLIHDAQHHLQTERAELSETQSEQQALAAQVEQAKSALAVTSTRLARTNTLFKEELVSRQEWEQVQAEQKKAEADLEVAKSKAAQGVARLESAKAQVEAALGEYTLSQRRGQIANQGKARQEKVYQGGYLTSKEIVEAENTLRQAQLEQQAASEAVKLLGGTPGGGNTVAVTSPIAGRVQERTVTLGEAVDTEHPLFTVVNLDVVWASLQVAPRDLARVRAGERVELSSEAVPGRTFVGKVSSVGTIADDATRAIPVRVALSNAAGGLRPGAFVRGGVVTDVRREQITIPAGAIQEHTGKKTLYVAMGDKPGVFEVRHVLLGTISDNGSIEVTSGLKGNERIAVSGTFYLKSEALKSSLSDGCCAVDKKKG